MPPDDSNPFGEMGRDARDHLRPASVAATASALVGFAVMGLGGLLLLAGVLAKMAGGFLWVVFLPLGFGISALGYRLYGRGQVRTRRGRAPAARDERPRH